MEGPLGVGLQVKGVIHVGVGTDAQRTDLKVVNEARLSSCALP
jgi:hypothetical protein